MSLSVVTLGCIYALSISTLSSPIDIHTLTLVVSCIIECFVHVSFLKISLLNSCLCRTSSKGLPSCSSQKSVTLKLIPWYQWKQDKLFCYYYATTNTPSTHHLPVRTNRKPILATKLEHSIVNTSDVSTQAG